jgi:hypothetical protein
VECCQGCRETWTVDVADFEPRLTASDVERMLTPLLLDARASAPGGMAMTDSTPATAASIPYEGTDCTPDEAVEAVKRYRRALRKIADCPNPDSVENCHDQMWVIAQEALGE